jgi:hypothetical protein
MNQVREFKLGDEAKFDFSSKGMVKLDWILPTSLSLCHNLRDILDILMLVEGNWLSSTVIVN